MSDRLAQYVFQGKWADFSAVLKYWMDSSRDFNAFVDTNKDKIRGKVKGCQNADKLSDVKSELEVAFFLLWHNDVRRLEYERYKKKRDGEVQPGPEFTVGCTDGSTFNMEVKHIRITDIEKRFLEWKCSFPKFLTGIRSPLALSVSLLRDDDFYSSEEWEEWLKELMCRTCEIQQFIRRTIPKAEQALGPDENQRYSVPGFAGGVEFELRRPTGKPGDDLSWYGFKEYPSIRTGIEYRKFGDVVLASLHQLVAGTINVLAILSDREADSNLDLEEAMGSLFEMALNGNDRWFQAKKRLDGSADFLKKVKRLSGVLFMGAWEPLARGHALTHPWYELWCNPDAEHPVPARIEDLLRSLR